MAKDETNSEIIQNWSVRFTRDLRDSELKYNIKHNRNKPPLLPKAKFKWDNGEIVRIGINLTKGLIMTHKGKGMYPENRVAKPFFSDIADDSVSTLADDIAANSGDFICSHINIR